MPDMTTVTPLALGPDGEACPQCGEALRTDQRYCLNCGRRRAQMRLPFLDLAGPNGPDRHARPTVSGQLSPALGGVAPERSPLVALTVLVALLLALGIGVLVGHGARGTEVVAKAPIVNVAPAPIAGGAATTAAAPVVSDWPAATVGWTVALRTLPVTATAAEVAQAKQEAAGAGASAVGVLRSDEFPSLTPGEILVYSGMFTVRPGATKALAGLRKGFPEAKVVRVRAGAPAAARPKPPPASTTPKPKAKPPSKLSPEEFQKQSKDLPDVVITP